VDWCLGVALGAMIIGIVFVMLGYIVPREYERDPDIPARKMEAIEKYYIQVNNALDAFTVAGMSLITLGAVILAVIVTVVFCEGEIL
ncbi:hypothetical protein CAPTEDRAFT_79228, partial [Capitella teleta]